MKHFQPKKQQVCKWQHISEEKKQIAIAKLLHSKSGEKNYGG